ncbi:DUF1727 domain-containing protein [Collinsella sp. zg1085]|uniref:MurT ligase domain-containing protein n=1 Tax=Collinsella sp. zg1085 TaxID=2844380 RepID=UPI001C0C03AC|nr:MurT ligase domain-containing protein [Collinsella sp. zg1085]QWT17492.1 DUF1727 domain-containing protein [Collinsella sp. zg1085]
MAYRPTPQPGILPRNLRFYLALFAAKLVRMLLRLMKRTGNQLPGVVAEHICPDFLSRVGKPERVVCITGTNGKTTTTNLLDDILLAAGKDPVMNRAGSNLLTGIGSSFLANAGLGGAARKQLACLELDELSCRLVLPPVEPELLVITNLYRDSYMRNANPDFIYGVIDAAITRKTHLILNADDLMTCRIASQATQRSYFSIARMPGDLNDAEGIVSDLGSCPECGGKLIYDYCHLRHLGKAHCERCGFSNPAPDYEVVEVNPDEHSFTVAEHCHAANGKTPHYAYHIGAYSLTNLYNLMAALTAARELGIPAEQLQEILQTGKVQVPEARYSEINVQGKRLVNLASKGWNSTAVSASFGAIRQEPGNKVVALLLADFEVAKDPGRTEFSGWIYQTDFEYLAREDIKQIIILGCYVHDLKLRLLLAGVDESRITFAKDELDAADLTQLDDIDAVFCAYDIHGLEEIERYRTRVAERLEAIH